ncbi:DUF6363 domain-containing protein [Providencia alcalifaciens]|uniref:patatin-like phospholipase family protein n=1 Tax=Providencia alcalifaciens TaxID=126385 RepID=UPI001CE1CCF8|nr:DUF6363 domain-containing protein [Providencia alcalifaciens]UBX47502.1 DUF6363 domain-containing protein [Providencia alcalifaciens]
MGKHVPVTLGTIEPLAFSDEINGRKTALICEGGGQRGIFTAGVLDEFLIENFNPFDLMIGTSAGAQNLSAYICGQAGYARRVITRYTTNLNFFNPLRFIRGGNLIDLDWLIETTAKEFPLNMDAGLELLDSGREFYMGASRSDDFSAVFLQPDADSWLDIIRASSAIPGFYRTGVEFSGVRYHDGGISAAIPVEEAYRRGADTIVVIRTVPSQMYFTPEWVKRMTRWLEGDSSALQRMAAMLKVHLKSYRKTQEFIENPPDGVQIFEIYPPTPLKSSALGSKVSALNQDYHVGRRCGRYFIAALAQQFASNDADFTRFSKSTNSLELMHMEDQRESLLAGKTSEAAGASALQGNPAHE